MTAGEPVATATVARVQARALEPQSEQGSGARRSEARAHATVVIPAYNEENGVAEVVRHVGEILSAAGIEHEILVVDDGSQDGTAEAARATSARVIQHGANRGYGDVQRCALLSVKTGGCPEDCAYCSQSARYQTPVQAEPLLSVAEVRRFAMVTDGVSRLIERYGWGWGQLLDTLEKQGPDQAVQSVREAELATKPGTFRGKRHDDD